MNYTPQTAVFYKMLAAHKEGSKTFALAMDPDTSTRSLAIIANTKQWNFCEDGNIYADTSTRGLFVKDSSGFSYPLIYENGSNLWLGAKQTKAKHHKGATLISSGYNGTNGNPTIYISVPNSSNDDATNYQVYHSGFKPSLTDLSGILPIANGGTGMNNFGAMKNFDGESVSVPNNTLTVVGSIVLEAGKWIIMAGYNWAANANGMRFMKVSSSSTDSGNSRITSKRVMPPPSGACLDSVVCYIGPAATTTFYCLGQQNSGGALNCAVYVRAIRFQ